MTAEPTRRTVASGIEKYLRWPLPVHDDGSVRLIDYMGTEDDIAHQARNLYLQREGVNVDDRLAIQYCMNEVYFAPFRECSLKLQVKLAISVARDWFLYCKESENCSSLRYSNFRKDVYIIHHIPHDSPLGSKSEDIEEDGLASELLHMLKTNTPYAGRTSKDIANTPGPLSEEAVDANFDDWLREKGLQLDSRICWDWKTDLPGLFQLLHPLKNVVRGKDFDAYRDAIAKIVMSWTPLSWQAFQGKEESSNSSNA